MAMTTYDLLLAAAEEIECARQKGCLHCMLVDQAEKLSTPENDGFYLLLCYEWIGTDEQRPGRPHWQIRMYKDGNWQRRKWGCDTGGYDNFEFVRWKPLPPI